MSLLSRCYPNPLKIVLTKDNKIAACLESEYTKPRANTKAAKNVKEVIDSNTTNYLYMFSNMGQVYKILGNDIPKGEISCGDVVKLEDGERIVQISNYNEEKYIVTLTTDGYGKKSLVSEFETNRKKAGVAGMKINDGAELLKALLCNDNDSIALMSSDGKGFIAPSAEMTAQGRNTKGRKAINLKTDARLAYAALVKENTKEVELDKKHNVDSIKHCSLGLMGNKI